MHCPKLNYPGTALTNANFVYSYTVLTVYHPHYQVLIFQSSRSRWMLSTVRIQVGSWYECHLSAGHHLETIHILCSACRQSCSQCNFGQGFPLYESVVLTEFPPHCCNLETLFPVEMVIIDGQLMSCLLFFRALIVSTVSLFARTEHFTQPINRQVAQPFTSITIFMVAQCATLPILRQPPAAQSWTTNHSSIEHSAGYLLPRTKTILGIVHPLFLSPEPLPHPSFTCPFV